MKKQTEIADEQFEEQILRPLDARVSELQQHIQDILAMRTLTGNQRRLIFTLYRTIDLMYYPIYFFFENNGRSIFK